MGRVQNSEHIRSFQAFSKPMILGMESLNPTNIFLVTLCLFNIAMENGPFIDDFPSYKPPFRRDFPWLC
jgi:hypothetical protein